MKNLHRFVLASALSAAALGLFSCHGQPAPAAAAPYDVWIANATVLDGGGGTPFVAGIGIRGGRIATIAAERDAPATTIVHATGLCVAPGFIDVHAHVDADIVRHPVCANFLQMGVTTLITGNCGSSVNDLAAHFARLDKGGVGPNYGSLVGHGTVRRQAMGTEQRAPTAAELQRMCELVDAGMHAGAFGLSTGLIYVPGTYAQTDEIIALAAVAGRGGGIYASHMRNENDTVLDSIGELLRIGREADLPVHVSHIKASGRPNWGRAGEILAALDAARREGVRVTADQYAYDASSTGLDILFPSSELAVGREQFGKRLGSDPAYRSKIKQDLFAQMDKVGFGDFSYARIADAQVEANRDLNGKTIKEAAQVRRGTDDRDAQAELAMDLFTMAGEQRVGMVYHSMGEADVARFMREPWIAVAADAGVRDPTSPSRPHPRGSGNNVRVLGRYVREQKVLDLPTAVHKMTALPARIFGIVDRGTIRPGAFADLVVFDAATVADGATFVAPTEPPLGVKMVLVNGVTVVADGKVTGARPGHVLRKNR